MVRDHIRMQVDFSEFRYQHEHQVVLDQFGNNLIYLEILYHLSDISTESVDVVIKVQLYVSCVLSQPAEVVKGRVVEVQAVGCM